MAVPTAALAREVNSSKAAWKFPTEAISRWEMGLLMTVNFFFFFWYYLPQKILLMFWDDTQIVQS